ncbi:MAG: MlaD family protein [Solirubrobacteraceae bacterium]
MTIALRQRQRRGTRRARQRYAFPVGIVVLAIVAAFSWIAYRSVNVAPFANPFQLHAVVPADAPILIPGDEVRIGGVRVGDITQVSPVATGRLVAFNIDHGPVGSNATVTVGQQGFSGAAFLDLSLGNARHTLREGATIDLAQTATNVDLATIATAFTAKVRSAITQSLVGYGGGLAGQGTNINTLLGSLPTLAEDIQPVAHGLTPQPGVLADLFGQLGHTAAGFATPHPGELGALVRAFAGTLSVTARRSGAVGDLIDQLRPFEDQALTTLPLTDPLLGAATTMSRRLTPALAELHQALPSLNALLGSGRDLPYLARLAHAAQPVLREGTPVLDELTPVGLTIPPLFAGLVPLANYLTPYRGDLIRDMQLFENWSQNAYQVGLASGAKAVRFSPVFTCSQLSRVYPAPGQSATDHASSLAAACH